MKGGFSAALFICLHVVRRHATVTLKTRGTSEMKEREFEFEFRLIRRACSLP
jgi:hypothetical protein